MRLQYTRVGGLTRGILAGWLFVAPASASGKSPEKWSGPPPTYAKEISRLIQKNCQECHRKGEIAPFPLETYAQARKRANDLAHVVAERTMPPWKAEPGVGLPFKDDRSLSAKDRALFQAWADAGAPRGDDKDLPPPVQFAKGWVLGKPDLIVEMAEEFTVPSSGPDIYRCFVLPTNLPQDMYMSAVEFQPGNHRVVHHIVTYYVTSGEARALDAAEPGPGYTSYSGAGVEIAGDVGGWTPGNKPVHLPDGIGRPLPKNSDIILQIHYHPDGRTERDRTRLGIYFVRTPVKQSLNWANATCSKFSIPAGSTDTEVKATWYVPVDVEALGVTPHMHQIGQDIRMTATFPGGKVRDLIHIPDWDPNWQNTYYFQSPLMLPKGSVVQVTGRYNNSAHPRNPNRPPREVRWGYHAYDEMCIGYIGVVKKGQDLTQPGATDDLFDILIKQHVKNMFRAEDAKFRRREDRRASGSASP